MKKIYAGIGSRKTPVNVLEIMTQLANKLEDDGWILRSGGADGADTAFERGVKYGNKEIYLPWAHFNGNRSPLYGVDQPALEMAALFHPAWARCGAAARKFHARNCYQVLGRDLETPADMIVCWTPGAAITGGTGQALRIADARGIAIRNLADPYTLEQVEEYIA
jgi:hypothetical protein